MERNYKISKVGAALQRARSFPRDKAPIRVTKQNHPKRPVDVVSWDPRLPDLQSVQGKHWTTMTLTAAYMREVFP